MKERDSSSTDEQELTDGTLKIVMTSLKTAVVNMLILDSDDIDRRFVAYGGRPYTKRQLAEGVINETPDGIKTMEMLINLTIDQVSRGKKSLFNSPIAVKGCDATEVKSMGEPMAHNTPVKEDWISVEDRLPQERERCLALVNDVVRFCKFKSGHFERETESVDNDRINAFYWQNVTHWQPLPAPPTNLISKPLK